MSRPNVSEYIQLQSELRMIPTKVWTMTPERYPLYLFFQESGIAMMTAVLYVESSINVTDRKENKNGMKQLWISNAKQFIFECQK